MPSTIEEESLFLKKDEDDLLERIANWRKYYRSAQHIMAVPWYTPPILGEVMQEDRFVKIPLNVKDAIRLEETWRILPQTSYKFYLKFQYVDEMKPQAIWRKMKNWQVKLRSDDDHATFDKAALEYFHNKLNAI